MSNSNNCVRCMFNYAVNFISNGYYFCTIWCLFLQDFNTSITIVSSWAINDKKPKTAIRKVLIQYGKLEWIICITYMINKLKSAINRIIYRENRSVWGYIQQRGNVGIVISKDKISSWYAVYYYAITATARRS